MKAVDVVKIEKLIPIFKNGEPANAIEVARIQDLEGNSCEFNIVVGKGLYKIGEEVVYIMPDYCLPDADMFIEYIQPGGDPSKCKLGKKNRIRAIKFNFQFENTIDPIYSNGILMSFDNLPKNILSEVTEEKSLQDVLKIIKYVADESFEGVKSGLTKGELPGFLYATDETRCELLKSHIERCYEEKEILSVSIKVDGSSISLYSKKDLINENERLVGICSRNMEKKLEQKYTSAYKDTDGVLLHQYYNRDLNVKGWFNDATQKFYTDEEVKSLEPVIAEIRDPFVDTVNKYDYLNKFSQYCEKYDVELASRGELYGKGASKGSGVGLNQDAKKDANIVWFGVDDLSSGHATRIHYGQEHNLQKISEELGFDYTKGIYEAVMNYDDIIAKGNEIFAEIKAKTGQIIEGIVIRSKYSNKLSCKYLNNEYDSKK